MIKYIFYCMLFSLSCVSHNSVGQKQNPMCGDWKWEKNDDKHDFTLQIFQKDSLLIGKHCYIIDAGSKIDCASEEKEISFKTVISDSTKLTLKIKSFYSNEFGEVEIALINEKLYWKLLKAPKAEYYFPKAAILIRNK